MPPVFRIMKGVSVAIHVLNDRAKMIGGTSYLTSCNSVGRMIGIVSRQRAHANSYAGSVRLSFSVETANSVFVPRKGSCYYGCQCTNSRKWKTENGIPEIVSSSALESLSRSHQGELPPNLASSELLLFAYKARLPQDLAIDKIR